MHKGSSLLNSAVEHLQSTAVTHLSSCRCYCCCCRRCVRTQHIRRRGRLEHVSGEHEQEHNISNSTESDQKALFLCGWGCETALTPLTHSLTHAHTDRASIHLSI